MATQSRRLFLIGLYSLLALLTKTQKVEDIHLNTITFQIYQ